MKLMEENKSKILFVCILFIIICIVVICFWIKSDIDNNNINTYSNFNSLDMIDDSNKVSEKTVEKASNEKEKIYVHIAGEVINQGVYVLNSGDRIVDIIDKAGGTTQNADLTKVNLAYKLSDGQKIYIPSVNEKNENNLQIVTDSSNYYNSTRRK